MPSENVFLCCTGAFKKYVHTGGERGSIQMQMKTNEGERWVPIKFEKWLAIRASVSGVGDMLAWVAWVTC